MQVRAPGDRVLAHRLVGRGQRDDVVEHGVRHQAARREHSRPVLLQRGAVREVPFLLVPAQELVRVHRRQVPLVVLVKVLQFVVHVNGRVHLSLRAHRHVARAALVRARDLASVQVVVLHLPLVHLVLVHRLDHRAHYHRDYARHQQAPQHDARRDQRPERLHRLLAVPVRLHPSPTRPRRRRHRPSLPHPRTLTTAQRSMT
mmetsp:Transcript_14843/g.46695  ORF Transcript_14843/g.46695 Transcript_14843/m.46695 type:complete len:202 (+) Transcript_14843:823-1428(+)